MRGRALGQSAAEAGPPATRVRIAFADRASAVALGIGEGKLLDLDEGRGGRAGRERPAPPLRARTRGRRPARPRPALRAGGRAPPRSRVRAPGTRTRSCGARPPARPRRRSAPCTLRSCAGRSTRSAGAPRIRGARDHGDHLRPVAAENHRFHVLHLRPRRARERFPEAGGVEGSGHAEHPLARELGGEQRFRGHLVQRVGDHDHHRPRRRGPDRLRDRPHRASVGFPQIGPHHAGSAGSAGGDHHHVGIRHQGEVGATGRRASRAGHPRRVVEIEGDRLGEPGHDVDEDDLLRDPRIRREVGHIRADAPPPRPPRPARSEWRCARPGAAAPPTWGSGGRGRARARRPRPARARPAGRAAPCAGPPGGGPRSRAPDR